MDAVRASWQSVAAYKSKRVVCATSLLALGSAFELLTRFSAEAREGIADLRDGFRFAMGIWPDGPFITLAKKGDRVKYIGRGRQGEDVAIIFKNLDAAVRVFTGQTGTAKAVAHNWVFVHGNLGDSMRVNRALEQVQIYLFPTLLLKKALKEKPHLSGAQLAIKAKVMAALAPVMALNAAK